MCSSDLTDGESQNLIGVKVNDLSEVYLTEGQSELCHIGTDLREGAGCFEIACQEIGNGTIVAFIRAVLSKPLSPNLTDQPQFSHYLQYRLFRDDDVELTT